MDRRSFLGRVSKALAGAVLGAHLTLGNLIPVIEDEPHTWVSYRFTYRVVYPPNYFIRVIQAPKDFQIDASVEGL